MIPCNYVSVGLMVLGLRQWAAFVVVFKEVRKHLFQGDPEQMGHVAMITMPLRKHGLLPRLKSKVSMCF